MTRLRTGIMLMMGAAAGAATQYFLDPQGGRRRRHTVRDRGLSGARRQASETARRGHYAAGHAKGVVASFKPAPSDDAKYEELGDAGLARKVESVIFRPADAPKGKVDVNAENGVISLRGAVEQHWIERLEREALNVVGVKAVRNLLHPPGVTIPPHDVG